MTTKKPFAGWPLGPLKNERQTLLRPETVPVYLIYRGNQMIVEVGYVDRRELQRDLTNASMLAIHLDHSYKGPAIEAGVDVVIREGLFKEVNGFGNVSYRPRAVIQRVAPGHPWLAKDTKPLPMDSRFSMPAGDGVTMAQVPEAIFGALLNMLGGGDIKLDVHDLLAGSNLMRDHEVTFTREFDPAEWKIQVRRRRVE